MDKGKWVVSRKGYPKDYLEVSIVREGSHGEISYGWGGAEKIVICSNSNGSGFDFHNEEKTQETMQWIMKAADVMAEALNREEL